MNLEKLVKEQLPDSNPVKIATLKSVMKLLKYTFPLEYKDFLNIANGGMFKNQRVIMYSCTTSEEDVEGLLSANLDRVNPKLFFIGRFSGEEFGYKLDELSESSKEIYVFEHETEKLHLIAKDLDSFLREYSKPIPPKKKWFSIFK